VFDDDGLHANCSSQTARGHPEWRHIDFLMKSSCERCGRPLRDADDARACSHDCTFCLECTQFLKGRCPNCGGELRPRSGAA
jgi:uncharacterized protein